MFYSFFLFHLVGNALMPWLSSTSPPPLFFFNLRLLVVIVVLLPWNHPVQSCYTSIFSFGDSLIDTGNLLHIEPSNFISRFPYGETYFHRATGRCSDGRVLLDFIAQALGIPLVPPYLARARDQDLRRGANFAVAGATALDVAFFEERKIGDVEKNVSFGYQIDWFISSLLPSLCQTPSAIVVLVPLNHLVQSCYTSFFSFGDSFIDTGNLLYLDPSNFNGRFPYGETYFRRATGRCSDGRLILDFIAQAYGIPLVPPYLARTRGQDLRRGANFAVTGATALDAAFFEERNITGVRKNVSFEYQIDWFVKQLLPSLCQTPSGCRDFLRRSLFLVGEIGGNDYFSAFSQGWSLEEMRPFVPLIINVIASAVDKLIKNGASTLVVPGQLPLGCFSAVLTITNSTNPKDYNPTTGCLKGWNQLNAYHNELLKKELDRLRVLHPRATIIYADYFHSALQAFLYPNKFGFRNGALSACCGGGGPYNYNSSAMCGSGKAKVCSDTSLYYNWDGSHPTEAGHRMMAKSLIDGPYANPPITSSCTSPAPHVSYPHYDEPKLLLESV